MKSQKENNEILQHTILEWYDKGLINNETKEKLLQTLYSQNTSKNTLVTFAVIGAISCGLLAFGTLILDERWIELLRKRFDFSEWIVGMTFSFITMLLVYYSNRKSKKNHQSAIVNEAFNILIAMSTAIALAYTGRVFYREEGNYAWLLLAAVFVYTCCAIYLRSIVLWSAMLLSLIGWWGAQTYFWSKGNSYFLYMNYPLRFTVFAVILLLAFAAIRKAILLKSKLQPLRMFLWFNLFITFWALSIFGNSATISEWTDTRQHYFWYWALAYSFFSIGVAVYGLKKKDHLLRDLGLSFILVNIYTRYFEYFWDKTNKGLFFAILAMSFWCMAKLLERWRKPTVKTEL